MTYYKRLIDNFEVHDLLDRGISWASGIYGGEFVSVEDEQVTEEMVYTCSPWQIRKALNAIGLRQSVESMVATSLDQEIKDGWNYASYFKSNDPFVISFGAALGMTTAELNAFIQTASTL